MKGSWLADSGVRSIGCGLTEVLEALGVRRLRVQLTESYYHHRTLDIDKGEECQPSLLQVCV